MNNLTPVVKNLILLNVLVFVACLIYGDDLTNLLAMHYPTNPEFKPWQIITHMFTHGGIFHILFNMYALYSFGAILENDRVLGSKRFAFLYLFSGLGAIAFHLAVQAFVIWQQTGDIFLTYEQATSSKQLASIYFSGLVGASGAIYGLLAAFGYLFPNAPLMFMFVPVPIKAKYMIPLVIIGFDIMFAQTGVGNIAHTAHIGGAIFGFLLVLFWNKTNKKTFY
jgi:rhomboid-like protein